MKAKSTNKKRTSALDKIQRVVLPKEIRQLSPQHCESYSEYLYQRGLMIEKLHRQRTAAAEENKTKGYDFQPKINSKSRELTKSRKPLKERTTDLIEAQRLVMLRNRSKSYKKLCPGTSPKKAKKPKKQKLILDPEDYDNFYKKNIAWLEHKENKREFLLTQKKRKEDSREKLTMVPLKYQNTFYSETEEPFYEDLYNLALFRDDKSRGLARVAKRLKFTSRDLNDLENQEIITERR